MHPVVLSLLAHTAHDIERALPTRGRNRMQRPTTKIVLGRREYVSGPRREQTVRGFIRAAVAVVGAGGTCGSSGGVRSRVKLSTAEPRTMHIVNFSPASHL